MTFKPEVFLLHPAGQHKCINTAQNEIKFNKTLLGLNYFLIIINNYAGI